MRGNYLLCRIASGETIDFDKITKGFCESVFAKLTDVTAQESVSWFTRKTPKLMMLTFVTSHSWEHYGDLVTYMRLKGIVPPSSEQQPPGR